MGATGHPAPWLDLPTSSVIPHASLTGGLTCWRSSLDYTPRHTPLLKRVTPCVSDGFCTPYDQALTRHSCLAGQVHASMLRSLSLPFSNHLSTMYVAGENRSEAFRDILPSHHSSCWHRPAPLPPPGPSDMGFFGADGMVFESDSLTDLGQEFLGALLRHVLHLSGWLHGSGAWHIICPNRGLDLAT